MKPRTPLPRNRKGVDAVTTIMGIVLAVAVVFALILMFREKAGASTKTINSLGSCNGTLGGIIAGNGGRGECRQGGCQSNELYIGEGFGCTQPGTVCCVPRQGASTSPSPGSSGTASSSGSGSKVYTCPPGSEDGCEGKTGHFVYDYNPGGGGAQLGCVYELDKGKPGICWQCKDSQPYCGMRTNPAVPQCSKDSAPECQNQRGIPAIDYEYAPDFKSTMCVFTPGNNGKDKKPVCWVCGTYVATCGQGLRWYDCSKKAGTAPNAPACEKSNGIFVGDYVPFDSKASLCVFEWLDPNGPHEASNINYCWVCNRADGRCGSGVKGS